MCLFISLGSWFARLIVSSTLFLYLILHYMYYNLYAFVYWMFLKTVSHAVKRLKKSSLSLSLSFNSIVFYGHQFLTLHIFFNVGFWICNKQLIWWIKIKEGIAISMLFFPKWDADKMKNQSYRIRCISFLHATLYIKQCRIYLKCLH